MSYKKLETSRSFIIDSEYRGLDRLNKIGVKYVFDNSKKEYHYDGWAWREILRRHPRSAEALEAQKRLASLHATGAP